MVSVGSFSGIQLVSGYLNQVHFRKVKLILNLYLEQCVSGFDFAFGLLRLDLVTAKTNSEGAIALVNASNYFLFN